MKIPVTAAIFFPLVFLSLHSVAQKKTRVSLASKQAARDSVGGVSKQKQLFLLDSAEIKTGTEEKLLESQVGFISTVKDPFTLFKIGYNKYDSVTFIFTKHYLALSPEQKNIPSQARLEWRKDNRYYFRGRMYTGKVIDYYYSGDLKSEAYYEDGLQKGPMKSYDINGILSIHTVTVVDTIDSEKTSADSSGFVYYRYKFMPQQQVRIVEYYYPNGAVKKRVVTHRTGAVTTEYLSSGEMTDSMITINTMPRTYVKTKTTERREKLLNIDEYDAALKREPNNPKIYLARSAYRIKNLEFVQALEDVNTCIRLEPQEPDYYGERALVPVYKAAYFDTDNRLKKREIVAYLRAHPNISITAEDKIQMMKDLKTAAVPFSTDNTFKEIYKYLKSINF